MLSKPLIWFWNPLYNPFRPWGVGVFFEIGIFFPVVFRSKLLVTAGFDMANTPENPFRHFYGTDTKDVIDKGVVEEISQIPSATESLRRQLDKRGTKVISLTVDGAQMSFKRVYDIENLMKEITDIGY